MPRNDAHLSDRVRRRRRRWRRLRALAILAVLVAAGVAIVRIARPGGAPPRDLVGSRAPGPTTDARAAETATTTTTVAPPTTTTTTPDGATGVLATAAVRAYLATRSGDITAAVYDVATGTTSLWRPGVAEYTASIVKVDILATLLHQHQVQGTPLSPTEMALATTMIEQSDDDAATDLWDDIGQQGALAAFNSLLPLSETVPGTDGHWGGTRTTAADQVRLLRALVFPSPVLDAASRTYELGLMENIEPSEAWGITAGVPAGVTVALKNGWLPLEDDGDWQVNSIGWVDGGGRDYILAVLTKNNPTEGDGIETIQGLSDQVWAALAS